MFLIDFITKLRAIAKEENMLAKRCLLALSLSLLATSVSHAQIVSGVMTVTGAEMH
jgi:hypothetical protein